MKRSTRMAAYIGTGILVGLLIGVAIIAYVTRSEWGKTRVRSIAVSWLDDRVQGTVKVGRITGGGLLRGAVLHDISIVGENKRPFFFVDSIAVSYEWRTLLGGEIVLTHATMYQPRVHLEKLPRDTAWNYQYIFEDTTPNRTTSKERKLILFDDVRIVNGNANVLMPVKSPILPGDTARMITQKFAGGLGRIMRFEKLQGRLARALWESPLESGRLFDVTNVRGLAYIWRDPVNIASASGKVAIRDTIVTLDFPDVRLPDSHGSVTGRVIMEEGRNVFDVQMDLDNFAFRDMQWLYRKLPDQGGGRGRLRILTQPRGTLFFAENARMTTPGSNLAGTLGIVVGDTLYFTKVDLRAAPLDIKLIKRLLPNGLPIDGLLMGTVEVKGPIV